jgi:threonine/homoserine/homoserine lactone efflux protein
VDTLLLGLALGLGAGLAPGPLLVLVVGATLARGFQAGVRVAATPLITDAPIVLLSVLVLRQLPEDVLAGLSLAGALVVGYLAWEALHGRADEQRGSGADLRRAALVNLLSPHPWMFWLTVGGPLLVEAGQRSTALAVAFVGGFYATLVGAKIALAGVVEAGARRVRRRLLPRFLTDRLVAMKVMRRFGSARAVSAVLLAVAAVALLADAVARLRA